MTITRFNDTNRNVKIASNLGIPGWDSNPENWAAAVSIPLMFGGILGPRTKHASKNTATIFDFKGPAMGKFQSTRENPCEPEGSA